MGSAQPTVFEARHPGKFIGEACAASGCMSGQCLQRWLPIDGAGEEYLFIFREAQPRPLGLQRGKTCLGGGRIEGDKEEFPISAAS